MTISARVISIFVTVFILEFIAVKYTRAEYILQPLPYDYQPFDFSQGKQLSIINQFPSSPSAQLLIVDNSPNYQPSITFGDLINASSSSDLTNFPYSINNQQSTINNIDSYSSSRSALIRNLLSRLENSYQESQLNQPNQQITDNIQQITFNNQPFDSSQGKLPTTNSLSISPTPYIPIPTLIAGISEIINQQSAIDNQQFTLNPQPFTPTPYIPLIQSTINTSVPLSASNQQLTIIPTPKNIYSIAILGDSMIDTLGRDLPDLQKLLKVAFPSKSFILLNYGQGATDMENGLFRLTHTTTYLDKNYAPLLSFKPDILVLESFAYNHWSGANYDLDRQWTTLVKIIETVKEISPDTKIILAATIGPNSEIYGDGKLNWNFDLKWQASNLTKIYLENMSRFAAASHLPFADAFHPSLGPDGNGFKIYINNGDHLHPSPEGALFFSQKIVDTIKNNQIIQ